MGLLHLHNIIPSRNKYFSLDKAALFIKMQKILQFFLELLQVAGGDLNISKRACFTVFHRWSGGRASLLKIQESHPLVTVTHPHSGEIKTIYKKDPNQTHRALGSMMITDGKSVAQFKVLKTKAKKNAVAILQSRMQRYDAATAYNCYYLVNTGYTIAATRVMLNQCKTIQSHGVCATMLSVQLSTRCQLTTMYLVHRLRSQTSRGACHTDICTQCEE
jgi:hypothetical protein